MNKQINKQKMRKHRSKMLSKVPSSSKGNLGNFEEGEVKSHLTEIPEVVAMDQ